MISSARGRWHRRSGQDGGAGGDGQAGTRHRPRPPSGTTGHPWPSCAPACLRCAPVTVTMPGTTPVVLIAEELAPSVLEVLGPDVEIRHVDGADRDALLPALGEASAVLIRSATQ